MPPYRKITGQIDRDRIKKISNPDISMLAGLFAFGLIAGFARKNKIKPKSFIFMLIVNYYEVFKRIDGYKWGLFDNNSEMDRAIKDVKGNNFVEVDRTKRGVYYLTLKGHNIIKEYNIAYKKRVQDILNDNANGNPNSNRRPGAPTHKFDQQNN